MITITDTAADKIKEILKAEGMPQAGLRVFTGGGGCGCSGPQFEIAIDDKAGDGDTVVENRGAKLYVDAETAKALGTAELGFISDERGEGFAFSFPNGAPQGGGCGCGPDGGPTEGGCGSGAGSSGGGCACG
ncbi:MAG: HesB/IscA family protein [Nitrospirota bacterium]